MSNLTSEMNWLLLTPQNGQTPQSLQFSVDTTANGLGTGSHSGFASIVDQFNPDNVTIIRAVLPVTSPPPPAPVIASVANAGSEENFIGPNEFVEIKGSNLVSGLPPSGLQWTGAIQMGNLPTSLGGASVTMNGQMTYVSFVSPGQINVLTPPNLSGATASVVVSNNGAVSNQFMVPLRPVAPALFEFDFLSRRVAATHADNTPVGYQGTPPAAPNETIQIWATGFGDTVAAIPNGQLVSMSSMLRNAVTATIGNIPANVPFAGLVAAGLYQLNITIPANAPNGDLAIKFFTQGVQTLDGIVVAVHN